MTNTWMVIGIGECNIIGLNYGFSGSVLCEDFDAAYKLIEDKAKEDLTEEDFNTMDMDIDNDRIICCHESEQYYYAMIGCPVPRSKKAKMLLLCLLIELGISEYAWTLSDTYVARSPLYNLMDLIKNSKM